MNNCSIIGRWTREPELKELPGSGTKVLNNSLAVDRGLSKAKKQEAEAKGYPTVDFIDVTAYGAIAELIANYTGKGNRVALTGKIQTRSYTNKEGTKIKIVEVVADGVDIIDFKERTEVPEGFHEVPTEDTPW